MPQVRIRDAGGTLRTLARIRVRDAGNVLRNIQRIRVRDAGNVLRTVWQYFSISLDTYLVTGSGTGSFHSGSVTSATVTGTVVGGAAPIIYLWVYIDGSATIVPTSPTAIATTFHSNVIDGMVRVAHYMLRATDNSGVVIESDPLEIQLDWTDDR